MRIGCSQVSLLCLKLLLGEWIISVLASTFNRLRGSSKRSLARTKQRMMSSDRCGGCVRWLGKRLPEPEPEPVEEYSVFVEVFLGDVTPSNALGLVGIRPSDTLADVAERVGQMLEPPLPEELSMYVCRWPPLPGGSRSFPLLPSLVDGEGGSCGAGGGMDDDDGASRSRLMPSGARSDDADPGGLLPGGGGRGLFGGRDDSTDSGKGRQQPGWRRSGGQERGSKAEVRQVLKELIGERRAPRQGLKELIFAGRCLVVDGIGARVPERKPEAAFPLRRRGSARRESEREEVRAGLL